MAFLRVAQTVRTDFRKRMPSGVHLIFRAVSKTWNVNLKRRTAMQSALQTITRRPQLITTEVLREKYCRPGEVSQEDVFERVAKAVASVEHSEQKRATWELAFAQNMRRGAIGAGRIMSAAGAQNKATLINCFVQPVGDAAIGYDEDGVAGIYTALAQAGETLRRGGGVGYNFSAIRPKGALVRGTSSEASGPCTFIDVFDASCATVMAAGARRGAQMGILNIDHPDVLDFIQAKREDGRWRNFNVSVGVTSGFMDLVKADAMVQLVHRAQPADALIVAGAHQRSDGKWIYREIKASELWATVMRSAYDFAEPGIVFLDRINEDNNLRYCETIVATNPCAEEPLPAYGCCDLGPIILPRFVNKPFTPEASFDRAGFAQAVQTQVRFLDNVLELTPWPLPEQKAEAQAKRRIGVGFTGLGNALAMLGVRYDSQEGRGMAESIARIMRDEAYKASVQLAIERGPFPKFNAKSYLEPGTFASRLPDELQDDIREFGIRNSHLLSIAPTGTVSLAFADNASNGIEPPFSLAYSRKKLQPDRSVKVIPVVDHGLRVFLETLDAELAETMLSAVCEGRDDFSWQGQTCRVNDHLPWSMVTALEMSWEDHLAMVGAVQPYIDTAISKTVNVPEGCPFEEFKRLYETAHAYGLKGCAAYRPNSILGAVLEVSTSKQAEVHLAIASVPDVDPMRVSIERRPEGELAAVTEKMVYYTTEGVKSLYLVVSFANVDGIVDGKPVTVERPVEVFIPAGQSDDSQQWITAAARMLSLTARDGRMPKALADLRKVTWDKGPVRYGHYTKTDGTRVSRSHGSEVAAIAYALQQILFRRGFLDVDGMVVPARTQCVQIDLPFGTVQANEATTQAAVVPTARTQGKPCPECGDHAVITRDGCAFCTNCGYVGLCG